MSEPNPFLQPGAPITPCGIRVVDEQQWLIVKDAEGQRIRIDAAKVFKNTLLAACSGDAWLIKHFPSYRMTAIRDGARMVRLSELAGFDQCDASAALIIACCTVQQGGAA